MKEKRAGLGRCVKRTIDGVTTMITYDDWKPIMEWSSPTQLAAWNAYGPGADEIVWRWQSGKGHLRYHGDRHGNVTALLDFGGNVVERYRYDVFGAPTITDANGNVRSDTLWGNRFLFQGREYFRELGLYDYRHRFYDPFIGRFIQTDATGFGAGDMNLFRYCGDDPVDRSDPMGLETVTAWQRQMLWQGGGDGGIWEQIQRIDQATNLSSAGGHVVIEPTYVRQRVVDQTRHDSQPAGAVDDEHFGDHGGAVFADQRPESTTAHAYTSERGVVRPVVDSQYGRYYVGSDGKTRPYGPKWSALGRKGAADHQVEIRQYMRSEKVQADANKAFARGGVKVLREEMNQAMSEAVRRSDMNHHGPSGDHSLKRGIGEPLPYDQ